MVMPPAASRERGLTKGWRLTTDQALHPSHSRSGILSWLLLDLGNLLHTGDSGGGILQIIELDHGTSIRWGFLAP